MSFVSDPTYETRGSVHCDNLGCDRQTLVDTQRNKRGWGNAGRPYTYIATPGWWYSKTQNSAMFTSEPHWQGRPDGIFLCPTCRPHKNKAMMNTIKVVMEMRAAK